MAGKGAGGRGHLMGQIFSGYVFFCKSLINQPFFKKNIWGQILKGITEKHRY